MKRFYQAICFITIAAGVSLAVVVADESFSAYVNETGDISLPEDFRTSMVHLGSWYVPAGDASGFHDVYTEQSTVEAYRRTGKFPDGATLVKELRHASKGNYTTGSDIAYANEDIKQWFVMVKDSQGRFADSPVWGDGWGWALFNSKDSKSISSNYQIDCKGCHIPAKDNDWVYTEAYPTLR